MSTSWGHGYPDIWLNVTLDVPSRVFLDEIGISIDTLSKADYAPQGGRASQNPLKE